MRYLILFFVLVNGLSFECNAKDMQPYYPGYVILKNGKKKETFIRLPVDDVVHTRCLVKDSLTQKKGEIYSSAALRAFVIQAPEGELFYEVFKVQVEEEREDLVFLRCAFQGLYSLYLFHDGRRYKYYLKDTEGELRILETEFVDSSAGGNTKIEKKLYQRVLRSYLHDCEEAMSLVMSTNLNEKDLVELFKTYHECINEQYNIVDGTKVASRSLRYGVKGGASLFVFLGEPVEEPNFRVIDGNAIGVRPVMGGFIEFSMPKGNTTTRMRIEANYQSYKRTIKYRQAVFYNYSQSSAYYIREGTLSFDMSYFEVPVLLKFNGKGISRNMFLQIGGKPVFLLTKKVTDLGITSDGIPYREDRTPADKVGWQVCFGVGWNNIFSENLPIGLDVMLNIGKIGGQSTNNLDASFVYYFGNK